MQCIQGCQIDFISTPFQTKPPHLIKFNQEEALALQEMICELEQQKVIEKSYYQEGDFMNNVFLREKKDSSIPGKKFRMILNVKELNSHVRYVHFKMDTLDTCLNLMEPSCYMASLDLSDAYHTIPMHPDSTKYLKFQLDSQIYKYLVLPQGFRDSPRLFTKLLKPVLAHLRARNFLSSVYIDDFYLQADSYDECLANVNYTKAILESLGFQLSPKSVVIPTQQLLHLGFILDSKLMRVSLGYDKRHHIIDMLQSVLETPRSLTVRSLAQLIGTLVASFPAVEYGPLYYRSMEIVKIHSLSMQKNFDSEISLSDEIKEDLRWWLNEGVTSGKLLSHGNPDIIIRTDSSSYAWGAVCDDKSTHGMWTDEERGCHINVLEIKGAMLGIQSLCKHLHNCHVQVQIDNTTAVAYINNMGGTHSLLCNKFARSLILWCKARSIWLSACHISGKNNVKADFYSRKVTRHTEWMLNKNVFTCLCDKFGYPEIDLFAARTNFQISKYMSFYPDPQAIAVNAFFHKWSNYVYLFPPFNLIARVLRKLNTDHTPKALIIVPVWPTQAWYPKLLRMTVAQPVILGNSKTLLQLPSDSQAVHPLFPKLRLMACLLSGKPLESKDYLGMLLK